MSFFHIVDHLGPKISVHAVSISDKKIKRNPYMYFQDPGCMGGWGAARAQDFRISIFVVPIVNLCPIK